MTFNFPTGDRWALFVWTFTRPLEENIQAAVFTWYKLNVDIPPTMTQAAFEGAVTSSGYATIWTFWLTDGVQVAYNYYMQSGGKKYSNTVQSHLVISPFHDVLPFNNVAMVRKLGGATKDRFLAPMRLPFIGESLLTPDGRWRVPAQDTWNVFENDFVVGFNTGGGGPHLSPAVYSIKNDSFTAITKVKVRPRPYNLRRRRYRQRKEGHAVTAPLNWGTPGHW